MEKIVRQSLLYDFYGELLTEHQKQIYEDVINNDMSYSEIAGVYQISRQGVYDMVKRCDKILEDYEEKLQLVKKFVTARKQIEEMKACISRLKTDNSDPNLKDEIAELEQISERILGDF